MVIDHHYFAFISHCYDTYIYIYAYQVCFVFYEQQCCLLMSYYTVFTHLLNWKIPRPHWGFELGTSRSIVQHFIQDTSGGWPQLKIIVVSRLNSGRSRQLWVRQSSRCCRVSGQIIRPRSPEILSIKLYLIFRQVWLPSSLENHRKKSRLLYSIWLFSGHDRLRSLQFFRYIFIY